MKKILKKDFFARPAPVVARDLLGKYIVSRISGEEVSLMITETEAYHGLDDLASHASKGRTERTKVMFGEAGRLYIYLIYGMYEMLNVVTGDKGSPSAVLIRSAGEATGPGKLTKYLKVTRELNTLKSSRASGFWFEDHGIKVTKKEVETSARIGVKYAGPFWSRKAWRFVYKKNRMV